MREISIEFTDYDLVANKLTIFKEKGYVLTPNIIFSRDQIGICFYYFNNVISEFENIVNVDNSKRVNFAINGGSILNIEYEKLANMTIKELADILWKQS